MINKEMATAKSYLLWCRHQPRNSQEHNTVTGNGYTFYMGSLTADRLVIRGTKHWFF